MNAKPSQHRRRQGGFGWCSDNANPTRIEDVELNATIGNAFDVPEISAKLDGRDIIAGAIAVNDVSLDIKGGLDALAITMDSSGHYQGNVPISSDLIADVSLGDDVSVTASRFDANIGDQAIALRKPLQFVLRANGRQQLDADLTVGTGHLRARLDQEAGQKSIAGELHLNDVDLGPWGRISGYDGLSAQPISMSASAKRGGVRQQRRLMAGFLALQQRLLLI